MEKNSKIEENEKKKTLDEFELVVNNLFLSGLINWNKIFIIVSLKDSFISIITKIMNRHYTSFKYRNVEYIP